MRVEFGLRIVGVPAESAAWAQQPFRGVYDLDLERGGTFSGDLEGQHSRAMWFRVEMRWGARMDDPWFMSRVQVLEANGRPLGEQKPLCFYVAEPTDLPTDIVRFPLGGYMLGAKWLDDAGAMAVLTVRRAE